MHQEASAGPYWLPTLDCQIFRQQTLQSPHLESVLRHFELTCHRELSLSRVAVVVIYLDPDPDPDLVHVLVLVLVLESAWQVHFAPATRDDKLVRGLPVYNSHGHSSSLQNSKSYPCCHTTLETLAPSCIACHPCSPRCSLYWYEYH